MNFFSPNNLTWAIDWEIAKNFVDIEISIVDRDLLSQKCLQILALFHNGFAKIWSAYWGGAIRTIKRSFIIFVKVFSSEWNCFLIDVHLF